MSLRARTLRRLRRALDQARAAVVSVYTPREPKWTLVNSYLHLDTGPAPTEETRARFRSALAQRDTAARRLVSFRLHVGELVR